MTRIGLAGGLAAGLVLATAGEAHGVMMRRMPPGEVTTGIGLGYYNQDLGRVTDAGFAWMGRIGVNALPYLGGEISYQGFGANVNSRFGGDAVQQAVSGNLKLLAPVQVGRTGVFAGYLFGGGGYSHIGFSGAIDSDNAFVAPLGGGIEYAVGNGLLLDGRFTYNLIAGERTPVVRSGDSWTLGVNLGSAFGGPY